MCVSFEPHRGQVIWIGKLDTVAMSLSTSDGKSDDRDMPQYIPTRTSDCVWYRTVRLIRFSVLALMQIEIAVEG
jgi:hypothetical protein